MGISVQGLALRPVPPRVFMKITEVALIPLREQGVCILAQSQDQLCEHRDLVLRHLSLLGLQVNWEESKISSMQRISFFGMRLNSFKQTARFTEEHVWSVLACLHMFKGRTVVPLKLFQMLLGHMVAAVALTPVCLLHMRPLQHWLYGRYPRWARKGSTHWVKVTAKPHPVVRFCVPPGRGAPRAGLQAYCGLHRCLHYRLVQTQEFGWALSCTGTSMAWSC